MEKQEFSGRTAAEAAIKACETYNVSRAELKYDVLSDVGEGLDRVVKIKAHVNENPPMPDSNASASPYEGGAAEGDRPRGRGRRPSGRSERDGNRSSSSSSSSSSEGGGGGSSRGRRGSRDRNDRGGRGGRGGRDGARRGGRRGGRGQRAQEADDGLEKLLNLEAVPADFGPLRDELKGDMSEKAQKGIEVLKELFSVSDLNLTPHLVQDAEDEIHIDLRGDDAGKVIGKKGEALLALQFILNRVTGRDFEGDTTVLVLDAVNYRSRRRDALADLATRLAGRAVEEGKAVRLSPMSAHDRRVFHLTLKEVDGVDTRSEGEGLYRNLLIIPTRDDHDDEDDDFEGDDD